jgi:hypothetical protein
MREKSDYIQFLEGSAEDVQELVERELVNESKRDEATFFPNSQYNSNSNDFCDVNEFLD